MNILQTESSKTWGGQEYGMLPESEELAKRGHRVFIVACPGTKLAQEARKRGLKVIELNYDLFSFFSLFRLIKREKINVIHCHSAEDHRLCYFFFRCLGIPLLRWRHIHFPISPTRWKSFKYRCGCDYVLTRCQATKDVLVRDTKVVPEKIKVIPGGVDFKYYHPHIDGKCIRREFKIPQDAPLIGIIAMLRSYKGHRYFIEGARYLLADFPNAYFLIVGGGGGKINFYEMKDVSKELKQKVRDLGLESRVIFTDYRNDIPEITAALDILVITSIGIEATPRVMLQGLAMQKPIVATPIGGIPEIIKHRETGLLVPPRDGKAMAEAVKYLLTHRDVAATLARNGYHFIKERFSIEAVVTQIEAIQDEVVRRC